jgi:hypothetical protein
MLKVVDRGNAIKTWSLAILQCAANGWFPEALSLVRVLAAYSHVLPLSSKRFQVARPPVFGRFRAHLLMLALNETGGAMLPCCIGLILSTRSFSPL